MWEVELVSGELVMLREGGYRAFQQIAQVYITLKELRSILAEVERLQEAERIRLEELPWEIAICQPH